MNAPDFESAVFLARRQYRMQATLHHKDGGDPAGTAFWQQQAREADRVLRVWKRLGDCPTAQQVFRLWLHQQGLCWYLVAWEEGTGNAFAQELGY